MRTLSESIESVLVLNMIRKGIEAGIPAELRKMPKPQEPAYKEVAVSTVESIQSWVDSHRTEYGLEQYEKIHEYITDIAKDDQLRDTLSWPVYDSLARDLYEKDPSRYVQFFEGLPHFQSKHCAKFFGTHVGKCTLNESLSEKPERVDEGLFSWFKRFYNWVIDDDHRGIRKDTKHKHTYKGHFNSFAVDSKSDQKNSSSSQSDKPKVYMGPMLDFSRDEFRRKVEGCKKGDLVVLTLDSKVLPSDQRKLYILLGNDVNKLTDHDIIRHGQDQYINNESSREFPLSFEIFPKFGSGSDYLTFDYDTDFPHIIQHFKPARRYVDTPRLDIKYITWVEVNREHDKRWYREGLRRFIKDNSSRWGIDKIKEIYDNYIK